MTIITKTQEQKEARWARIAELQASNQVMTAAQRVTEKRNQKKETLLQEKADRILNTLTSLQEYLKHQWDLILSL